VAPAIVGAGGLRRMVRGLALPACRCVKPSRGWKFLAQTAADFVQVCGTKHRCRRRSSRPAPAIDGFGRGVGIEMASVGARMGCYPYFRYLAHLLSSSESMVIKSLASLDFGSTCSNPSINL